MLTAVAVLLPLINALILLAALEYMQVTTLLPGTALAYLAYNLMKPWAIRCA